MHDFVSAASPVLAGHSQGAYPGAFAVQYDEDRKHGARDTVPVGEGARVEQSASLSHLSAIVHSIDIQPVNPLLYYIVAVLCTVALYHIDLAPGAAVRVNCMCEPVPQCAPLCGRRDISHAAYLPSPQPRSSSTGTLDSHSPLSSCCTTEAPNNTWSTTH